MFKHTITFAEQKRSSTERDRLLHERDSCGLEGITHFQDDLKFPGLHNVKHNSGAPAGAEGVRGRSTIAIQFSEPIKPRKFGCHVRTSVRTD